MFDFLSYTSLMDFVLILVCAALLFKGYASGWLMDAQYFYFKHVNRFLIALGDCIEYTFGKRQKS